ncbi:MAG: hypothetical protein R3F30_06115 [Planctomycetota bacterium]
MRVLATLGCLSLAASLPAQNYIETFPFPDGTGTTVKIPLWTPQTGKWVIQNKRLVQTGGATWSYITSDRFTGVADCVLDVDVYYGATTALYFGGTCARHPGNGSTTNLVMCKIQDNSTGGSFNRTFLYEQPGGSVYYDISPVTKAATVRMFVKGNQAWCETDGNKDGTFEQKSAVRTLVNVANNTGMVGISGYNAVELDDFKYYRGMLVEDATTTPKIGTTYKMTFSAPLENSNPTPWLGLCSLGRAGIPIGGVTIPLTLDALLVNSLGFGWSGVLTSTSPTATIPLAIPNDSSLVGLNLWVAALTFGSGGFGSVSNDHHVQVVQ